MVGVIRCHEKLTELAEPLHDSETKYEHTRELGRRVFQILLTFLHDRLAVPSGLASSYSSDQSTSYRTCSDSVTRVKGTLELQDAGLTAFLSSIFACSALM